MFPDDLPSYLWGAATIGIAWFLSSFFGAAGSDAWSLLKRKVKPGPMKVSRKFSPEIYAPGDCAWVGDDKIFDYEDNGYEYYPHPKNGAKCFREIMVHSGMKGNEWLMVKPGAEKIAT